MKTTFLKLCITTLLSLTIAVSPIGQTVCSAQEEQTAAVEEEIINVELEEEKIVTVDINSADYDMWSIPEDQRTDENFGPAFDRALIRSNEIPVIEPLVIAETESLETASISDPVPIEPVVEVVAPQSGNRWGISLTAEEKELLARIVKLESEGESNVGQQAVVEVVFNRVADGTWPNTVIGVLSQKRQFSTWPNVNGKRATPTAKEYANIEAVVNGETNILPLNTVYFSRGAQNKRVQTRIGGHVFCNK